MKRILLWTGCVLAAVLLGVAASWNGVVVWDDWSLHHHSRWLMYSYGLDLDGQILSPSNNGKWTGPLWAMVLGIATEVVLPWLRDPFLVRHALTFALLPLTLLATFLLLRKAGVARAAALLACALLLSIIRFGGHALVSPRDFPHAAAFLLTTLGLWVLLRGGMAAAGGLRPLRALSGGALSVVPFLVRSPDLLHAGLFFLLVCGYAAAAPGLSTRRRFLLPAAAAAGIALPVLALSPMLWETPPSGWLHPIGLFSRFTWRGSVRIFGETYNVLALPRIYALLWIPVIVHPLGLLTAAVGWLSLLRGSGARMDALTVKTRIGCLTLSLTEWIVLVCALAFAAVLVLQPYVYDEERHLLFLYPPLFLLGALGLARLPARAAYGLAAVLTVASAWSYAHWGRYAYVYKSPLIGDRSAQRFMGDHRYACLARAVSALEGRVGRAIPVVITGPAPEAASQHRRLRESLLVGRTGAALRFQGAAPDSGPYVQIVGNRMHGLDLAMGHVAAGRATILWQETMPPGDVACAVFSYPRQPLRPAP